VSSATRPILTGRKISRSADAKTAGPADDAAAAASYRRNRPQIRKERFDEAMEVRSERGGRARAVRQRTRLEPEAQSLITAHLPSGEIVVVGESNPGGKVVDYAITGGTGA